MSDSRGGKKGGAHNAGLLARGAVIGHPSNDFSNAATVKLGAFLRPYSVSAEGKKEVKSRAI